MYAIIKTGGKQVRVQEGDVIDVELLGAATGEAITFDEVLLLNKEGEVIVGVPTVSGCVVKGTLIDEVKGAKVISYKFKRRKNYHRKLGHRQRYSRVEITAIEQP